MTEQKEGILQGNGDISTPSQKQDFFLNKGVKAGFNSPIRIRIDALLNDKKLTWVEVYKLCGLSKCHASMIRNGKVIPRQHLRIKIAQSLGTDTSVIWQESDK